MVSLGLTAAALVTDAAIQKKIFVLGTTALIISNNKMNEIMKIVNSLNESSLLIKCVSETIKNEAKGEKGGFIVMSCGTIAASILGNMLAGNFKIPEQGVIRVSEGVI